MESGGFGESDVAISVKNKRDLTLQKVFLHRDPNHDVVRALE